MLRNTLTNLTIMEIVQSTERTNFPTPPSSSPSSVTAAINVRTTISTNPSMASTSTVITTTAEPDHRIYNATGYLAEHDELDYSILAAFSDMQTVFLACILTLLPLIVALGIAFAVRHIWRKYRNRRNSSSGLPWYRGVCSRDDTAESLHHRPHSGSVTIQQATRILSAQDLVNGIDGARYICETEVVEDVAATESNGEYSSPGNYTSKSANGNIITLTLKSNHLIVETEARAVTMEDTKNLKYEDSSCSFMVEVQPGYQSDDAEANKGSADDVTGRVSNQQALVHREEIPDDRPSGFENTKLFGSTNTGLSQSDLSISSLGSTNPSYRYGNQIEYDAGHFGYPMYVGYETNSSSRKLNGGSRWVEFDKSPDTEKTVLNESNESSIEKEDNETLPILEKQRNVESSQDSGSSMEQQDSTDASNSTETVWSNPNLQVNGTTPNKLEIMEQKALVGDFVLKSETTKPVITGAIFKEEAMQEDTFQEQQRKLGNGTLTPEHDGENPKEQEVAEAGAFVPCHKRTGSIPPRLIETSMQMELKKSLGVYGQMRTGTKSILPGLSPKFELLQNEVSPIEEKSES